MAQNIRNIAIIAHVDHGKTTLVDGLLRQAGSFRTGEVVAERAMDSNDLERERGITILSKCTSVSWKGTRINIVDTPGHADFGGEVERVLGMVDSVLLLVDAYEGAMPQTRFVTQKAFEMGLRPIVVINKIDRAGVEPDLVIDQVFDLFVALGASEHQLDFPVIYASGRQGFAIRQLADEQKDLSPLLDLICEVVPPAAGDPDAPYCMQVATLDYDDYLGYMAIGRVRAGRTKVGDRVLLAHRDGSREEFRVQKVLGFQGLKRFELAEAVAGDICALTGMSELNVGETVTSIQQPTILPLLKVDAPTITMNFRVNDGPFAGRDGKYVTSRNLRERLDREIKSNVALRVEETAEAGVFKVSGRGELHLSVLIETMRREGYELCVSQPQVITQTDDNGKTLEPYEDAVIDLDEAYVGAVVEELGRRLGQMREMRPSSAGRTRLEYRIPARGLIGYRSQFMTDTRGTGVLYTQFAEYGPWAGTVRSRNNGVLIANETGVTNAYALFSLQERGQLFVGPGIDCYPGMVVGIHSRDNDLVVNPNKSKKLTNIRTTAADEKLVLAPPRPVSLEYALEFINDDELVEVTPAAIRLRKAILDHNLRKRSEKKPSAVAD
ncbi:MAG: translational GTPase TypA [Kofleriaceae bacterium]|jgi:GTP-binding protein|nr:translational GTPase TypA [Kofleriaceae bacterium]MBP6835740.1 translational GTPase TypA [Kofleriaceae bacterium]MBP9205104.1 translational GTPase TypA [Kofleriaceae bacterium]